MAVSETPIATNLNKALDIKANFSSKFPLNLIPPVNNLPKTINFLLGEIIRLHLRLDLTLS